MKYYEAFGEAGFHSAFMTTFAFGAQAFEDIPFPRLKSAGCRNIVVLADRAMTDHAFADFGPPRFAGSSYHLIKTDARAAFHPKITLLLGEKKGRLMVGSANLTALGLGGNRETVSTIIYSENQPNTIALFSRALRYIRAYMPQDYPGFEMCLERALRNTPWLREAPADDSRSESNVDVALLHDQPDTTILQQLIAHIGPDKIKRLTIISPYWDQQLEGLQQLQQNLAFPETHLLLDSECGFPIDTFGRVTNTRLFDMKVFAQGRFLDGRFLHAKLIIAEGEIFDHVLSGSANCTSHALLGLSLRYGNAEAGIYKRLESGIACAALGLVDYEECTVSEHELPNLADLIRNKVEQSPLVDGGSLVLASNILTWTVRGTKGAAVTKLNLYDRDGVPVVGEFELRENRGGPWFFGKDDIRPRFGEVLFSDGTVSSPVIVTDLDILAATTRPAHGGKRRSLINALMDAIDADLSTLQILRELQELDAAEKPNREQAFRGRAGDEKDNAEPEFRILSYEEFVRVRTAAQNGTGPKLSHFGRHDSASTYVSDWLNRLIGLVGPDLAAAENAELERQSTADIGTTEPDSIDPDEADSPITQSPPQPHPDPAHLPTRFAKKAVATAKKLQEAVDAMEKRCLSLRGKAITTDEIVRARLVLQILLDHAQPKNGGVHGRQVLPTYTAEGYDWPRLIGRVLKCFLLINTESHLQVEPNEIEQHRVLECLAACDLAANLVTLAGTNNVVAAASLTSRLTPVVLATRQRCAALLEASPSDRPYFDEVRTKYAAKYADLAG